MAISMSSIWDETVVLLRRESALMVPLALATIGIGSAVSSLAQGTIQKAGGEGVSGLIYFALLMATILTLVGNLAVTALALRPGMSVGEALRLGLTRLPKMVAISILFGLVVTLMVIPLAVILIASGVDIQAKMPDVPPLAMLYALVAIAALFYLGARMFTVNALVVDKNPPVVETIKQTFAATQGLAGKIIGVTILFLVVAIVFGGATTTIFGAAFALIGKMIGSPFAALMMTALVGGMVSAGLSLISTLFAARLYTNLSIV
jgi:hypothetical protein